MSLQVQLEFSMELVARRSVEGGQKVPARLHADGAIMVGAMLCMVGRCLLPRNLDHTRNMISL
jgi:hypothetical protein